MLAISHSTKYLPFSASVAAQLVVPASESCSPVLLFPLLPPLAPGGPKNHEFKQMSSTSETGRLLRFTKG